MKRIIAIIALIALYVYFEYYFPIEILDKAPLLLSILFSVILVVLALLAILNVYNFKKIIGIANSSKKILGMFIGLMMICFVAIFMFSAHFYINYADNLKVDLEKNPVKTTGVILDKYTFNQRRKLQNYSFTVVKVKYQTSKGEVTTEHNSNLGMKQLPNIGEKINIIHSANIVENFIIDGVENNTKIPTADETMQMFQDAQ